MVDVNIKRVLYGIAAALPRLQLRRATIWLTSHRLTIAPKISGDGSVKEVRTRAETASCLLTRRRGERGPSAEGLRGLNHFETGIPISGSLAIMFFKASASYGKCWVMPSPTTSVISATSPSTRTTWSTVIALRNAVIDTSRNVWVREEQSGNTAGSRTLRSS